MCTDVRVAVCQPFVKRIYYDDEIGFNLKVQPEWDYLGIDYSTQLVDYNPLIELVS